MKTQGLTWDISYQQEAQLRWISVLSRHSIYYCSARQSKIPQLNQSIAHFVFEQLRKDCNRTDLNEILDTIDGMIADHRCSRKNDNQSLYRVKNEWEDDETDKNIDDKKILG